MLTSQSPSQPKRNPDCLYLLPPCLGQSYGASAELTGDSLGLRVRYSALMPPDGDGNVLLNVSTNNADWVLNAIYTCLAVGGQLSVGHASREASFRGHLPEGRAVNFVVYMSDALVMKGRYVHSRGRLVVDHIVSLGKDGSWHVTLAKNDALRASVERQLAVKWNGVDDDDFCLDGLFA